MPYTVQLKQFEGPLDLLLHLIEEAELDVKDIFVSEITAQYLSYMDQLEELDMDTASEFLSMAATLLYIKSRQLLPRPPKEDEAEEDPETLLIRQLREYKAFKEASEQLRALFDAARELHTRLPLALVVHVTETAPSTEAARDAGEAIREHFTRQSGLADVRLSQLVRDGLTTLAIGLAFLSLTLTTAATLGRWAETYRTAAIVREGVIICGWVAAVPP